MYHGITLGKGKFEDGQALRQWLESADSSTSIPYRIEGLDAPNYYPRVLTAAPVEFREGGCGWAIAHCITLDDSILIGTRNFVHDDCPKPWIVEMDSARHCFAMEC